MVSLTTLRDGGRRLGCTFLVVRFAAHNYRCISWPLGSCCPSRRHIGPWLNCGSRECERSWDWRLRRLKTIQKILRLGLLELEGCRCGSDLVNGRCELLLQRLCVLPGLPRDRGRQLALDIGLDDLIAWTTLMGQATQAQYKLAQGLHASGPAPHECLPGRQGMHDRKRRCNMRGPRAYSRQSQQSMDTNTNIIRTCRRRH